MADTIQIILKAIDNATKDIKNVSAAVKGVGGFSSSPISSKLSAISTSLSFVNYILDNLFQLFFPLVIRSLCFRSVSLSNR